MANDNHHPLKKLGDRKNSREQIQIREEGFREGLTKGRQEIIDWLEIAYTGPGAPDRGTPEAEAILELARQASLHFKMLNEVKGSRGHR